MKCITIKNLSGRKFSSGNMDGKALLDNLQKTQKENRNRNGKSFNEIKGSIFFLNKNIRKQN